MANRLRNYLNLKLKFMVQFIVIMDSWVGCLFFFPADGVQWLMVVCGKFCLLWLLVFVKYK